MWQSYANIWFHFIWSTKERYPLITSSLKYKLYDFIRRSGEQCNIRVDMINGTEDHIHCLVNVDSKHRIFEIAKQLKGTSSHYVNKSRLINDHFQWQDGYAVFSISPSHIQKVRNYIKNQEIHHSKVSFLDEMSSIISVAGVGLVVNSD